MTAIDRFRERVEQLERDHAVSYEVCRRLINEMRLHPRQTTAERDKAQGLVARIERVMHGAD